MRNINSHTLRLYAIVFAVCVALAALSISVILPVVERNSVRSVILNGKVLLGYPNSVPVGLTFKNGYSNYSAIVGDITGSCACGGYYYMVTLPNQVTFKVYVYYKIDNTTRVCQTDLRLSSVSDSLNQLIRCP